MKNVSLVSHDVCCGCGTCSNVCPRSCISMVCDAEGFAYPSVDEQKCIECGACLKKCPVEKEGASGGTPISSVVLQDKDGESLENSTSGGAFACIARYVLKLGGVVFGAAYDGSLNVSHIAIERLEDLRLLQGSKYVSSDLRDSYNKVKTLLKSGRLVLFSGTPCQVAGLKNFLHKDYPNLYTLDFLCHGVPSPKTFSKNIREWEKKEQDKIVSYHFRDKLKSWNLFNTRITFRKGRIMTAFSKLQYRYFQLFLFNFGLQEACYHCQYTKRETVSDITMADYWKECAQLSPKKIPYDDKGLSLAIINSQNGANLFRELSSSVTSSALNYDEVVKKNKLFRTPFQKPADNDVFWSEMMKGISFHDLASRLLLPTRISLTEKLVMRYGSNPIIRLISKLEYRYNKYFIQKK